MIIINTNSHKETRSSISHFVKFFAIAAFISVHTACGGGGEASSQSSTSNLPEEIPPVIEPVVEPADDEPEEPEPPVAQIEHAPAVLEREIQCDAGLSVGLSPAMISAIDLAEVRYRALLERIDQNGRRYIDYTSVTGVWQLQNPSRWTSGFLPGVLWYLYALTEAETWRVEAESSTEGLRSRALATDNDTGFQIYGSYGIGREVLGGDWPEADLAIADAAATLIRERYNPTISAFRAWPQSQNDPFEIEDDSPFEVNVDMIMNMEVILAAAERAPDAAQLDAVLAHADLTWDYLMRPDFSSYHVAAFDEDGNLSFTRTEQGWIAESTWSRGQSWAVYGYAMLYRYTQEARMLERAEKAYQFFKLAVRTQSLGWVPYADFDAVIDLRNPLDSSAAAVVASAAIELYELSGNTLYLADALDILNELIESFLSNGSNFESLLLAASEEYVREDDDTNVDREGYEVGASFGDFYFLEALYRLKNTSAPQCN